MKFKSLIFTAIAFSAVALTSCDGEKDATYVPGQPVEIADYYFSNSTDSTKVNLGDTDKNLTYTVYRKDVKGTATIPVSYKLTTVPVTGGTEKPADKSLVTVPTSVTFADGANETTINCTLDPTALDANNYYYLTLSIGDEITPYFTQEQTYRLKFNPFEDVVGPNGETKAILRDFVMNTWFNVGAEEFEVTLQKSPAIPGLYRLVNPYGLDYPYNEPADIDGETHYLYFNASNPKAVFMCTASGQALEEDGSFPIYTTGINWGYGMVNVTSMYGLRMAQGNATAANQNVGTLAEGILTFEPKTWLARMEEYTAPGNWSYAATEGFYLRWPGVKEPEPETPDEPAAEWVGIGACSYTDPFIYPLFGVADPQTYDVEVEKNTKTPGVFRMVNPYKDGVMPDGQDYDGDLYIEIDCTNSNCVEIALQNTGFEDQTDGATWICNRGYANQNFMQTPQTPDQIIAAGLNDVYNESTYTINLATANALFNFPDSDTPTSLYTANNKIEGSLVMNSSAAAQAKLSIATARTSQKYFKQLLKNAGFNTVDRKPMIKRNRAVKSIVK